MGTGRDTRTCNPTVTLEVGGKPLRGEGAGRPVLRVVTFVLSLCDPFHHIDKRVNVVASFVSSEACTHHSRHVRLVAGNDLGRENGILLGADTKKLLHIRVRAKTSVPHT